MLVFASGIYVNSSLTDGRGGVGGYRKVVPVGRRTDYVKLEGSGPDGASDLYMVCDFARWEKKSRRDHCKQTVNQAKQIWESG